MKGDAAKKRQERRAAIIARARVGDPIFSYHYGMVYIMKVNKTTLTVNSGRWKENMRVDASYFRMPTTEELEIARATMECQGRGQGQDQGPGQGRGQGQGQGQGQDQGCTCSGKACLENDKQGMPDTDTKKILRSKSAGADKQASS